MALATSGTALAAYGPPPPPTVSVSSSYHVVTSFTVGPGGKTVKLVLSGGFSFTLRVPQGTFMRPMQVTLTAPQQGTMSTAATHGRALGGLGVLVQHSGAAYHGQFRKPMSVTVASRTMAPGDRIAAWRGTRLVTVPGTTARPGGNRVHFRVRANRDFAFVRPASRLTSQQAAGTRMAPAGSFRAGQPVLAQLPAGPSMGGLGVLAPGWLRTIAQA